jgi:hypothetical protein
MTTRRLRRQGMWAIILASVIVCGLMSITTIHAAAANAGADCRLRALKPFGTVQDSRVGIVAIELVKCGSNHKIEAVVTLQRRGSNGWHTVASYGRGKANSSRLTIMVFWPHSKRGPYRTLASVWIDGHKSTDLSKSV